MNLFPGRSRIFVDSSGFYAMFDREDADHTSALQIQSGLPRRSAVLVTSNFIIGEVHALFLSRLDRRLALEFLDRIEKAQLTIVRAEPDDEARAVSILHQYDGKDFSYVDALSFAIMHRLGIEHAFGFDRHFAQFGLTVLTPAMFDR